MVRMLLQLPHPLMKSIKWLTAIIDLKQDPCEGCYSIIESNNNKTYNKQKEQNTRTVRWRYLVSLSSLSLSSAVSLALKRFMMFLLTYWYYKWQNYTVKNLKNETCLPPPFPVANEGRHCLTEEAKGLPKKN